MGLQLDDIVPWGRSLEEYCAMFALSPTDLGKTIVDCAAGPASFNAEMTARGYAATSYDPIYHYSASAIAQRIQQTKDVILAGVRANLAAYVWRSIASPEQLCQLRLAAMNQFLADFPTGLAAGRYHTAALPHLPLADCAVDLALCSHFLFTYTEHLSLEFHWQAIQELCRVASEVRIFPVVTLAGTRSPYLDSILDRLNAQPQCRAIVETVDYEFQVGGNQQLRIISEVASLQQSMESMA